MITNINDRLSDLIIDRFEELDFRILIGEIINKIIKYKNALIFELNSGKNYAIMHCQDCCEEVYLEDIIGNLENLLNYPIILSEKETNNADPIKNEYDESHTWTFIKLSTYQGYVTLRFYGSSNGYYSEDAGLYEVIK
jgi:hypothetical protein